MRTGVVLPTFRETPDDALAAAGAALAAGVDGVFCYDHLWPMGQPERPALAPFPILATLAAASVPREPPVGGPYFGTLVARVNLVPTDVLVDQFVALEHIAPGRIIAGIGTGDRLSREENIAYGLPTGTVTERRDEMVAVARRLRARDMTVWLAAGAGGRVDESAAAGASAILWGAEPELVKRRTQGPGRIEVIWAGPTPTGDGMVAATVGALAGAGASWSVFAWPIDPRELVDAARSQVTSEKD
ncbi:MAG TPA: hypothetical protein VL961_06860 [Acidimicrobiales bacterium]|nr:hypothetical protein [Acidimicrobiales bacterium]